MIKIAPSILSADFANLERDIKKVEEYGADMIHVDVMDGLFVPNITIGAPVVRSIRKCTGLILDVHLMIENPDKHIEDFVKAGSDIITIHQEATKHLHRTVQSIKKHGIKCGVAINPATSLTELDWIIEDVDMVLIMTVNPGFGGQSYIESMTDKVRDLKKIIDKKGLDIDIEVDGGVSLDNVKMLSDAGANVFVSGSSIFNSKDMEKTMKDFKMLT